MKAGMDDFLTKPVEVDKLKGALDSAPCNTERITLKATEAS